MGLVYAKNQAQAIRKTKAFIRNVMGENHKKYTIKVIGKPNPKFKVGKSKGYNISVQKKNKR